MRRSILALIGLAAFSCCSHAASLRIMTFNVRYPSKNDGANLWEARRDILVRTIRMNDPDIVGTQELFYEQGQYAAGKLPAFTWFGISRRGNHEDEHMGVFYRKDRLELLDSGNFWLSETPEVPGSMSWDVSLPRMVTWGTFRHRASGRTFHYFDTHFPHRREDSAARVQCAEAILNRIKKLPPAEDVILTGDFNSRTGSEPYSILTRMLNDAHRVAPEVKGPEGTFHAFRGTPFPGRIDWILYRGNLKPVSVDTITYNENGRYPSDHFPVVAVFDWIAR